MPEKTIILFRDCKEKALKEVKIMIKQNENDGWKPKGETPVLENRNGSCEVQLTLTKI